VIDTLIIRIAMGERYFSICGDSSEGNA